MIFFIITGFLISDCCEICSSTFGCGSSPLTCTLFMGVAVVVSRFDKVVLCPIALRTLVGIVAAGAGDLQVLSIAVQAKNPPRQ